MIVDSMDLALELESKVQKLKENKEASGWGFTNGMVIFRDPKMLCPFCKKTFPSGRIWLASTRSNSLLMAWKMNGTRVPQGSYLFHPNAPSVGGKICMGDAPDAPTALFAGLNPGPGYHSNHFVWELGHKCKEFQYHTCPVCEDDSPSFLRTILLRYGAHNLCSKACVKKAQEELCRSCLKPRKVGDYKKVKYGSLCPGCFEREYEKAVVVPSFEVASWDFIVRGTGQLKFDWTDPPMMDVTITTTG